MAVQPPVVPGAIRTLGQQPQQQPAGDAPTGQSFDEVIRLLKQAQLGASTTGNAAQQEQFSRLASTPQGLEGASPAQQDAARSANVQAIQPTISGARDAIQEAKSAIEEYNTTQAKLKESTYKRITDGFTAFGGGAFDALSPEDVAALEKAAGLPKGYIQGVGKTVKERELELKKAAQLAKGGGSSSGTDQLYDGLSPSTATAVRAKVTKFSSEPIVTNFGTIQEGYNFAKSIPSTTKNPTDDQALVYQFAKIMDPGSVVREGEYATVQKYAQSWIGAFGKSISQAINGTGFLSPAARENIKKTIESRYIASKNSYDSLASSTAQSINNLTGRDNGTKFLTEYTYTPPTTQAPPTPTIPAGTDGASYGFPGYESDGSQWVLKAGMSGSRFTNSPLKK